MLAPKNFYSLVSEGLTVAQQLPTRLMKVHSSAEHFPKALLQTCHNLAHKASQSVELEKYKFKKKTSKT